MKKITVNKTRILTAAAALVAVFSLAGCGSNAVQEIPRSAETSRAEEATPETAAPEVSATSAPTPEPAPAVVVPTSVTLEQEGGILNNGMTWTLHATVLPEDAADKTITWTSADESVATIDDSGVITTHAPGQTTITAASEAGGVSTTYTLLVQEVATCSYCGGTGHTASACPSKAAVEQTQAASVAQQAAEKQQQAESLQAEITSSQEEIYAVLSQATKPGLAEARNLWDRDLPSMLEEPAKTVLGFLQPIAASDRAVLLSSQSRAWQLATNPQEFLATLKADLDQLTKESWTIAIVDEKAWPKIRQEFIKEHASQLRAKAQPEEAQPAEEAAPEPPLPDQAPPEEAADDAIVTKAEELFGPLAQVKD